MVFGYVRVSTKEQNAERQKQAIADYCKQNNITLDRVVEEKASGRDFDREVYQGLKTATLREGDILIIKELDRLGRNMEQIKKEWQDLQKIGVDIIILDSPMLNTKDKTDLEKILISNIIFEVLTYVAQKELEKIRARQAEGIAIAKSKGVYKGRKPTKRDNFEKVYASWKNGEITATKAWEILNLSKTTFYRKVRAYEADT